jgi:periplasmic protein CpxP/Spy
MNMFIRLGARPRKALAIALLVGAASTLGVSAIGQTPPADSMSHGHHDTSMGQMGHSPDAMRQHLYSTLEPSDSQKAKLDPLLQQTTDDFSALHTQLESEHREVMSLLTTDKVDRAALERWRVAQIQQMDRLSKQLVGHMADAADVLTPAQRRKAHDAMAQHQAARQAGG